MCYRSVFVGAALAALSAAVLLSCDKDTYRPYERITMGDYFCEECVGECFIELTATPERLWLNLWSFCIQEDAYLRSCEAPFSMAGLQALSDMIRWERFIQYPPETFCNSRYCIDWGGKWLEIDNGREVYKAHFGDSQVPPELHKILDAMKRLAQEVRQSPSCI
jgi:hypothetical protein